MKIECKDWMTNRKETTAVAEYCTAWLMKTHNRGAAEEANERACNACKAVGRLVELLTKQKLLCAAEIKEIVGSWDADVRLVED